MTQYPRRPPRLGRVFQHMRPFYFVTFNTHLRKAILANDALHDSYISFCKKAETFGVAMGRYVIMPDHIHLFVALPSEGHTLPAWVQSLKSVLGKELLRQGCDKPHWQEGFFDHLMRSSDSYSQKWNYVWQNPVRKALVKNPDDWPYQGKICVVRW